MQPTLDDGRRDDGFKPKYRHFHPNDRVWVKNPFNHDVVYQVADEYNRPFRYRLPAGVVSELPGGAIATLGVKALVDELIQNTAADALLMWDYRIRTKHENTIIQQVRSTSPAVDAANPGEVNLASTEPNTANQEDKFVAPPESAFPGLNQAPAPGTGSSYTPSAGLRDVVSASLPTKDSILDAQ